MPTSSGGVPDTDKVQVAYLTLSLTGTGTVDIGTVSGGDILIERIAFFLSAAAGGLTSVAVKTNNGTLDTLLAATILALLGVTGTNLTAFSGPIVLPNAKKIQGIFVGTGNAGTLRVAVVYRPLAAGAVIS